MEIIYFLVVIHSTAIVQGNSIAGLKGSGVRNWGAAW